MIPLLAAAVSLDQPVVPIRLRVLGTGGLVGEAYVEEERSAESRRVRVEMTLTPDGGRSTTIIQETLTAPDGSPVAARLIRRDAAGDLDRSARFDPDGAMIAGGRIDSPAPPGLAADAWFWARTPKPGEKSSGWRLRLTDLQWERVSSVYYGEEPFSWGGRTVMAHHYQIGDAKAWCDAQGRLYRLARGGMIMIREEDV
jgi:hypothetical protein